MAARRPTCRTIGGRRLRVINSGIVADDLAGIEDVFRIEDLLDLPQDFIERTGLPPQELRAA